MQIYWSGKDWRCFELMLQNKESELILHQIKINYIHLVLSGFTPDTFLDSPFENHQMSNAFDYYDVIRKQQIHINKIVNPQVRVPKHQAYKPMKAKIQQERLKQRLKKQQSIERQNMHIMKKLCSINYRKPSMGLSHSSPSFSLPPIILQRKQFQIPEHQRQNNIIAQKLVNSKSSINVRNQLKDYYDKQKLKKNISKYHSIQSYNGSEVIDRKKYIAELMMLKKLKLAQATQSRIKNYVMGGNATSRVTNNHSEREYYTNS